LAGAEIGVEVVAGGGVGGFEFVKVVKGGSGGGAGCGDLSMAVGVAAGSWIFDLLVWGDERVGGVTWCEEGLYEIRY